VSNRFVPDYPGVAELKTGSAITPPELATLFGRVPSNADLRRFRDKLETVEPLLSARVVIQDRMLKVIGEIEAIERRAKFCLGTTKANITHAGKGNSVQTHKLSAADRKRADMEQMVLQRHAIAQGAALTNLIDRQLTDGATRK
jgi:hypothetical protein